MYYSFPFAVVILLVACVACSSGAAAAPTPTPTPLPPFTILSGSTGADLFDQLPNSERSCITETLAPKEFQILMEARDSSGNSLLQQEPVLGSLAECIGDESAIRLFLGSVIFEAEGLSSDSILCIRNVIGNFEMRTLLISDRNNPAANFSALVGLMLCLTEQESRRVNIGGGNLFGSSTKIGPSLFQIQCAIQKVELDIIMEAVDALNQNKEPPAASLAALSDCGVDLGDRQDSRAETRRLP